MDHLQGRYHPSSWKLWHLFMYYQDVICSLHLIYPTHIYYQIPPPFSVSSQNPLSTSSILPSRSWPARPWIHSRLIVVKCDAPDIYFPSGISQEYSTPTKNHPKPKSPDVLTSKFFILAAINPIQNKPHSIKYCFHLLITNSWTFRWCNWILSRRYLRRSRKYTSHVTRFHPLKFFNDTLTLLILKMWQSLKCRSVSNKHLYKIYVKNQLQI